VVAALLTTNSEDDLGKHELQFRCVRPTGQPLFEQQGGFDLKPQGGSWLATARLIFQMQGMPLPDWGKYVFTIMVDGAPVASHPLTVVRPPPPPR